jgi:1-acyl-sn-glycerol-3-phosphate acyltransferase
MKSSKDLLMKIEVKKYRTKKPTVTGRFFYRILHIKQAKMQEEKEAKSDIIMGAVSFLVLAFALIDPKSPPEKGTRFYRFILNSSLPLMLWMAKVKVKLSGLDPEEIPNDEKMLFVCNHLSELDPIILMSVFPEHNIGFVGKKDICTKMPLIAKSMRKLYGVFVDRENDREAAKSIIEASHILKDKKASVGLFPE